mgnify:FL=1
MDVSDTRSLTGGARIVPVLLLVACASRLPAIVLDLTGVPRPTWLSALQVAALLVFCAASVPWKRLAPMRPLAVTLAVILLLQEGGRTLSSQPFWRRLYNLDTLTGSLESGITLKALSAALMAGLLLLLLRSPTAAYLVPGNLSAKARRIAWLGIEEQRISWGKLSVISGVLISLGTILLTVITVTGFRLPSGWQRFAGMVPLLLLLAAVNSISEGVLYRNGVLGPLQGILSDRWRVIAAAMLFGLAHFEGAPGGPIGVMMSGLLGWYMNRSMLETKGFATAWIIHFMQDFVICGSLFLLNGQLAG